MALGQMTPAHMHMGPCFLTFSTNITDFLLLFITNCGDQHANRIPHPLSFDLRALLNIYGKSGCPQQSAGFREKDGGEARLLRPLIRCPLVLLL